jgi:hypothetical protein
LVIRCHPHSESCQDAGHHHIGQKAPVLRKILLRLHAGSSVPFPSSLLTW